MSPYVALQCLLAFAAFINYLLNNINIDTYLRPKMSRVSLGTIVSDYGLDDRAIGVRCPAGQRIFPIASLSRPALGPTQPPVQWVPGVLSPRLKRGRGVTLTTHSI
jgi:hypothetical protein